MREPALFLNGMIIQRRLKNTEVGFQIKQAPSQLVNFRYKFINFLSLSPLEPSPLPPPKGNIEHKKTMTKIRYQHYDILHLSYNQVASENSKSLEQLVHY